VGSEIRPVDGEADGGNAEPERAERNANARRRELAEAVRDGDTAKKRAETVRDVHGRLVDRRGDDAGLGPDVPAAGAAMDVVNGCYGLRNSAIPGSAQGLVGGTGWLAGPAG
jgi:hypothetical protein